MTFALVSHDGSVGRRFGWVHGFQRIFERTLLRETHERLLGVLLDERRGDLRHQHG